MSVSFLTRVSQADEEAPLMSGGSGSRKQETTAPLTSSPDALPSTPHSERSSVGSFSRI